MSRRLVVSWMLVCLGLGATAGCGAVTPARRALRNAVSAKQAELDGCFADTLTRNAGATGGMALWMEVESENGRVSSVQVESSDVADEPLNQCVIGALQGIQLAEAPPIPMRVHYQLVFQNTSVAPPPPSVPAGEPPPPPSIQGGQQPPPPSVPAGQQPPPPAQGR